ncbi:MULTISPECIES: L-serine ammonia-lyase, iron-sulfur-dependent, subunit alpha [Romboutsia]|uniref:L-serine dehydratase n=1 Tax=Romboutsia hominis TaxID=1507512 RepID=A0A2P2BNZ3_9FIRM|nr:MULTISPECIES: L-serine ammonia-lyase, iron-sulfur-dependent, subunit alpha [Romboutsia]MCH1959277.1 L-serine ammonia-lyase, iron-sulfur-dependent, subunit alpha [Romboutsia hominis]MCH1970176.1 L-serine ammonia-lyase, iron-sulfur-dependent, subunit alpha [Romboutsia hominis]MDB8790153.1 L-serine ammonia-lyase, iron-sulfur-dependent, subunit alpha [Romboutsia sp. 1001216sp1]MDB8792184.1 L-serine ammonia-lyase, iron-sulfur-dependent, subunit alpha [Romboutsia sp. 1001216sp1]MDB8797151.1 L-ser
MKYNFTSGAELLEKCKELNMPIHQLCLEREAEMSGLSKEEIREKMMYSLSIMKAATERAVEEDIKSMGGLIGGEAKKLTNYRNSSRSVCGELMNKAMVAAMGTMEINASMGLIVAAPTAGSCGILPGAVVTIGKEYGFTDEQMVDALFTASAIGAIITRNATVAGAEGGCQAETGAAAAMAAAGVVEMMGGKPEQAIHAASHCLQNVMGLICDPIAGLVEAPCQGRNAIGVANALISAELVLAGILNIVPFDETVEAMYKVGKTLPMELRETALGGVAATCTGCSLTKKIFG